MDERFATALRAALVDHVEAIQAAKPRRRLRWHYTLAGGATLVVVGDGVAFAAGALSLPGSNVVTHLASPTTVTGSGTKTVELGKRPAGATSLDIKSN